MMYHGNWKELSSHPTMVANSTAQAQERLYSVHLLRSLKWVVELEYVYCRRILEPYNPAAAGDDNNNIILPFLSPRIARGDLLFGAEISKMFQNTRQIKTTPPVYHMLSWKKKEMGKSREKKQTKKKRLKIRNHCFEDCIFSPFKSIQPKVRWIYAPLGQTDVRAPAQCQLAEARSR